MSDNILDEIVVDKTYDNAGKYIKFLKMYECPHCHTLVNSPKIVTHSTCTKCSWKGQVI